MKRVLSDEDIVYIFKSGLRQKSLARRFKVSQWKVSRIKTRLDHKDITEGLPTYQEETQAMKERVDKRHERAVEIVRSSESAKVLAKKHGISVQYARNLKTGKTPMTRSLRVKVTPERSVG
jgi:DNA-binding transcriptional regulator LsrR (DeoR family)